MILILAYGNARGRIFDRFMLINTDPKHTHDGIIVEIQLINQSRKSENLIDLVLKIKRSSLYEF